MDLEYYPGFLLSIVVVSAAVWALWVNLRRGKGLAVELLTCIAFAAALKFGTQLLIQLDLAVLNWADRIRVDAWYLLAVMVDETPLVISLGASAFFACVACKIGAGLMSKSSLTINDLLWFTAAAAVVATIATWHPLFLICIDLIACITVCCATMAWRPNDNRWRRLTLVGAASFVIFAVAFVTNSFLIRDPRILLASSLIRFPPIESAVDLVCLLPLVGILLVAPQTFRLMASWIAGAFGNLIAKLRQLQPATWAGRYRPMIALWRLREGVCYLNHGSFGAVSQVVRREHLSMQRRMQTEPMDFMTRHYETLWLKERLRLAAWVGARERCLALCENATAGMNEIAGWFPLSAGDEVLLNNHEYGAVVRCWTAAAERTGASVRVIDLPTTFDSQEQITELITREFRSSTKLLVVSHITSATALKMPVEQLCEAAARANIATCIDGPHALLQEQFQLEKLGCDFYTASCHKWLCAPIGTGFVYVAPKWHDQVRPLRTSWGRLSPAKPQQWDEELMWSGTRDPSALLSIHRAINFAGQFDWEWLDERNHSLAKYARRKLLEIPGVTAISPDSREFYGWMVSVRLPAGDHSGLQQRLWNKYSIEVPIFQFEGDYLARVSCPLYISRPDVDFFVDSLRRELGSQ